MEDIKKVRKNRERSIAYPSITLEAAIARIGDLQKNQGAGPFTLLDAAKGIGYSGISGASARAVAALVHYGLLERSGNTYMQSKIAQEILFPVSDEVKTRSITQAAQSPRLFMTLIKKYTGQAIPAQLDNLLIREGVSSGASKETANTFRETLKFAGLLKNGVVLSNVSDGVDTSQQEDAPPSQLSNDHGIPGSKERIAPKGFIFSDSGKSWRLSVTSDTPLTSEIKTALIGIADKLEQINKDPGV